MADETGSQTTETPTPDAPVQTPQDQALPMGDAPESSDDWSPPKVLEDGTSVDGHGLPLNLRLRKAALAEGSLDEDPTGQVTVEEIDAEVDRLEAFDKQYPAVAANMKVADLEKLAKLEGVDLTSADNNDDRVALISAARPSRV